MTTETRTVTDTIRLTRRSRNLGYGWTNSPARDGSLSFEPVTAPRAEGSLAAVTAEAEDARRINSGNSWADRLFVSGRPVRPADGSNVRAWELVDELRRDGFVDVVFANADDR